MTWADSMRVISAETQQLIDEVYDPDCHYIGPYECNGDNIDAIEDLLWDHGLVLDDNGYAVPVADEDEDDASILGDDDDGDEEVIAFCDSPECRCLSTFAYDNNREDEPGPGDPNLICGFCGCAPGSDALEAAS